MFARASADEMSGGMAMLVNRRSPATVSAEQAKLAGLFEFLTSLQVAEPG
jgi:hypothetical protein